MGNSGDELPDSSHLLGMHQLGTKHGRIGNVRHDCNNTADPAIFTADRAEINGELPTDAIAANQRHIEIIDLFTARYGRQCLAERGPP